MSLDALIIGTEQLGGTDWGEYDIPLVEKAISCALDLGVRSFDTAHIYGLGLAEKRLSNVLGHYRHECSIITKVGLSWGFSSDNKRANITKDLSYAAIRDATEESLRNLRLDKIPILLAHWPDNIHEIEEVVENLYRIQQDGLVQYIGLSNFNINEVLRIQPSMPIDCYQGPLNLLDLSNINAYKKLTLSGINVMSYGPLAHGLLTGKYNSNSVFLSSDRRHRMQEFSGELANVNFRKAEVIRTYSEKLGCTMTSLSIAMLYKLGFPVNIIVGVKNISQLDQNIEALSINIPDNILTSILSDFNSIN
jgi:aryl-alcohol dehydrogenase-like predicted oxidoreductase